MAKVKYETWGKHKRVVARDEKGRILTHKKKEAYETIGSLRETFKRNNSLYEEVIKRKRKNVWEVSDYRIDNTTGKPKTSIKNKVAWYMVEGKFRKQSLFAKSQNIQPPLTSKKISQAQEQAFNSLYKRTDIANLEGKIINDPMEQDPFSRRGSDADNGELLLIAGKLKIVKEGLVYYEDVKN